jgi:hypothetical protein
MHDDKSFFSSEGYKGEGEGASHTDSLIEFCHSFRVLEERHLLGDGLAGCLLLLSPIRSDRDDSRASLQEELIDWG